MLGVLVGLKAEAAIFERFFPKARIAISNAKASEARRGVESLCREGATHLISFGCAAGLSQAARPGDILVPRCVVYRGRNFTTDQTLSAALSAGRECHDVQALLHSDAIIASPEEKAALFASSDCFAADMESGYVAKAGLPFAVLRVVCDGANRRLPPLVNDVLVNGGLSFSRMTKSLVQHPLQIFALGSVANDALRARYAMKRYLRCVATDRLERL